MASLSIITGIIKGIAGVLKSLAIPLMMYFAGKKAQESKNLKEHNEKTEEASKLDDGISRANDDDIDSILHN